MVKTHQYKQKSKNKNILNVYLNIMSRLITMQPTQKSFFLITNEKKKELYND